MARPPLCALPVTTPVPVLRLLCPSQGRPGCLPPTPAAPCLLWPPASLWSPQLPCVLQTLHLSLLRPSGGREHPHCSGAPAPLTPLLLLDRSESGLLYTCSSCTPLGRCRPEEMPGMLAVLTNSLGAASRPVSGCSDNSNQAAFGSRQCLPVVLEAASALSESQQGPLWGHLLMDTDPIVMA